MMEQALLNTELPAAMVYHRSKDSCKRTPMVQSGDMYAQDLAERAGALQLKEHESNKLPGGSRPFHHLNFFGVPVFRKCATPPATSLAILMSERQGLLDFEEDIRKAILVWDALPFLEPVAYWGPHNTLEQLKGTALKEAVTGQCGKLYTNDGTWLEDQLDEDEDAPLNYNDTAKTDVIFNGQRCPYNFAPTSQSFIEGLHDTGKDADEVKRFMQRREQSRARPRSSLRQITSLPISIERRSKRTKANCSKEKSDSDARSRIHALTAALMDSRQARVRDHEQLQEKR